MKLLRVGPKGAEIPALLDTSGTLRDLSAVVRDIDGTVVSDAGLARLRGIDPASLPALPAPARIGPAVARPLNFVCIGLNYRDHAEETGNPIPKEPIIFLKALSAFCGPNDDLIIPRDSQKTDWEVELGVVIGRESRYVPEAAAMEHVAGYVLCNDVSERAFQNERGGQWDKGKGCDNFGPTGPWFVSKDEIPDPQALKLWLEVDGVRVQDGTTANMIFGVAKLVSYVSHFITLQPGDIISTGTPAGVGMGRKPPVYLRAGQTVRLGADGLGEQSTRTVQA